MKRASRTLLGLAAAAAALIGCGDPPDEVGPVSQGDGNAMAFYVENVHEDIALSCGGCHAGTTAPPFMAGTAEGTYAAMEQWGNLIVAPDNSELVLHGEHAGPALTIPQDEVVREWLDLEVQARGGASSGGGATVAAALKQVAECMSFSDWEGGDVGAVAATPTEQRGDNSGVCYSCHNTGQGGAFFDANPVTMFLGIQELPYINRWFVGQIGASGAFTGLMASDRIARKGVEAIECEERQDETNEYCHPTFEISPEMEGAITGFIDVTIARFEAGRCDEATEPPAN
jgi:hypothetical protein